MAKPKKINDAVTLIATGLKERAGAGILLLALFMTLLWGVSLVAFQFNAPKVSDMKDVTDTFISAYSVAYVLPFIILIGALVLLSVKILTVAPVMVELDSGSSKQLEKAFGAKIVVSGESTVLALEQKIAIYRVQRILICLAEYVRDEFQQVDQSCPECRVRSSIFTTQDGIWLRPHTDTGLLYNFKHDRDATIGILNGFYSSGSCFKYLRPILSLPNSLDPGSNSWAHRATKENLKERWLSEDLLDKQIKEIDKASQKLQWILSMPIPYQIQPFRICAGVLSIDCFSTIPQTFPIREVLASAAFAAALIGAINRHSRLFGKIYYQSDLPILPELSKEILIDTYNVDPVDYDPALVPTPNEKFVRKLASITGIGFLAETTPETFREFVDKQLKM